MAKPRMDLTAFVGKLLEEQNGDMLREGVRVLAQVPFPPPPVVLPGARQNLSSVGRQAGYNCREGRDA